uniref:Phytase-like domain-containing protein n=1 Tax=Candidatus Kentrum sp. TC TaxID=2126339 RepID=A0A450ZTC4_9GAMM|nr:MAG: hypothetical protein BECKTC1821D_GA0114238_101036 [Candidatus Kentron sp. TC]VFK57040.1 MAG: hypothetical protein BECKTC1821F_GA0114240_101422 [Candidatus Kentron sp. TC]
MLPTWRTLACLFCIAPILGYPSPAQEASLVAKGIWIDNAAGIQASGLTSDSAGRLWIIGDQNTKRDNTTPTPRRLFRISMPSQGGSNPSVGAGKIISYESTEYDGDFEGVCIGPTGSFFAITESRYRKNGEYRSPSIFEFDSNGRMPQGRTELGLDRWADNPGSDNERLEGIAYGADRLFLAYEKAPRILVLSIEEARRAERARGIDAVTPRRLDVDLRDASNINGLVYMEQNGKQYLLAIARNRQIIVSIEIYRRDDKIVAGKVGKTSVKFLSPDSDRELCWASPEGITVSKGEIWIISDPPYAKNHRVNYRELRNGEVRASCHENSAQDRGPRFNAMFPILFSVSLDNLNL